MRGVVLRLRVPDARTDDPLPLDPEPVDRFDAEGLRAVVLRADVDREALARFVPVLFLAELDRELPPLPDVARCVPESSSSDHLPDITRCAASATASAISEPSLVALLIMLLAA